MLQWFHTGKRKLIVALLIGLCTIRLMNMNGGSERCYGDIAQPKEVKRGLKNLKIQTQWKMKFKENHLSKVVLW